MTHDIPKAEAKHLRRLRYFSPTTLQSLTFTYTYPAQKRSERERKPAPKKMGKGSWMEQLEAMIRGMDKSKAMSMPAEQPEEVQEKETLAVEQEESVQAESTAEVDSHKEESIKEMSETDNAVVEEAALESAESEAVEATSSEQVVEEPSSKSEQVVEDPSSESEQVVEEISAQPIDQEAAEQATTESFSSEVAEEHSEIVGAEAAQEIASAADNNEPQFTDTTTAPSSHFTRDPRVTVLYTAVVSRGSEIDMMMPDR